MPRCFSDNTLWCLVATTPRIRTRRGPPRTFRAFSDANYRLLWPANFLSFMSRWMQMFTLGWFVLVRTDSPWLVVMVGFSGTAPMLLLGLFGGYLADSFPRQRLIVLTQLACLVAAVAMTVLLANDGAVYWHAYLMALVIGGAWALDMPARRSAIHDLLGSTGVTNGLALDTVGMSASRMLGPALAGVLISTMGFAGAYASCDSPLRRRSRPTDAVPSPRRRSRSRSVKSLEQSARRRPVREKQSDASGGGYGDDYDERLALPIHAPDPRRGQGGAEHGRIYIAGSILSLVALFVFALSSWYALSLPALIVLGFGAAGFSTMQATLIMLVAEKDMRGKALGVVTLAIGTGPLGVLSLAAMTTAVSAPFALGVNAVLGTIALLVIGLTMRTLVRPTVEARTAPAETAS